MDIFIQLISKYINYLIMVAVMFLLDTITGLSKAFYHKNYMSSKARKCFSKLAVYISLIFACVVMESIFYYTGNNWHFTHLVAISMCIVEFTSIAENFEDITGKNFITDFIALIVNKAKSLLNKSIEEDTTDE